jgi:putative ABC transport system permease protein
MTPLRLILRNLTYFRAASLAVVAGMVVATAVLAGSLMVGDSVRGSLRTLAVKRLGPVDYALVAGRFFDDSAASALAARVAQAPGVAGNFDVVPAVVASGSASVNVAADNGPAAGSGASTGTPRKVRVGDVQILGFGEWQAAKPGSAGVNAELHAALGAPPAGTPLALTFPSQEDAARESTVARRGVEETSVSLSVGGLSLDLPGRASADMFAGFNLQGGQRTPRNAWVNLRELQDAVQQPTRANVLLARDKTMALSAVDARLVAQRSEEAVKALNDAVRKVVTLGDYGLAVGSSKSTGERIVSTSSTYLAPPVVQAAVDAARKLNVEPRLVTVNLVNRVVVTDDKGTAAKDARALHYVIGAGISHLDDVEDAPDAGGATASENLARNLQTGVPRPATRLAGTDIVFNDETAKQLNVAVGDHIRLDYYRRDADGNLTEVTSAQQGLVFRVARVIKTVGVGADASLTPAFKGLTDTDSVADWRPPKELKIDEKLAEKDNDAYWKRHKAAPRLFVPIDAARKLWGGPYGDVTGVRVPAAKGDLYAETLRTTIDPAALGFAFQPVKLQQLAASAGSTDFSGLFVGFSFFLIAAAALLVAMLFRLNVEQRVRQFGLLAAVGFSPKKVRWLALAEGAILAVVGGAVGVALGVAYTWAMVYGLRTWWVGAVGTTALELYVLPKTLWAGFIFGFWVALLAVLWAVWRIGKVTPARLMVGQLTDAPRGLGRRTGRVPRLLGVAFAVAGLAILGLVLVRVIPTPEVALGGGAVLLTAGLCYLGGVLRPRRHEAGTGDVRSVAMLGVRNANRHTARSVLSVGLIAFAAFTLITVASMQKTGAGDTGDPKGGAGGYRLIAQAAVPILADLNTPAGRDAAGFTGGDPTDAGVFRDWPAVKFALLRRWAGQDISCLNMTKPTSPTVLGVPKSLADQNRFSFAGLIERTDKPWSLLEKPQPDGAVPVVADNETAQYILHLGVGDTLTLKDQLGRNRTLRLVGTLSHSVFQSELLMGEANFRDLFPAQAGFGTLLVDCPPDKVQAVQQALNAELEPYAVSVDTTAARLEAYQQVQNTYLSTFRALGSLGLALGTIGLAVVLVRNVIERRGELALLSALGFLPKDRVKLILTENVLLLVLGLGVGTACALLGIVPTLLTSKSGVNWGSLGLTLVGVLVLGLVASVVAVRMSGLRATPKDLRRE